MAVGVLGFPALAPSVEARGVPQSPPKINSFGPYQIGMPLEAAQKAHPRGRLGSCGDVAAGRNCVSLQAEVFEEPATIHAVLDEAGIKVDKIVAKLDPLLTRRRAYRCIRLSEKVFALLVVVYGPRYKQSYDQQKRPLPAVAWDGELEGRLVFEANCKTHDEGTPKITVLPHRPDDLADPAPVAKAEPLPGSVKQPAAPATPLEQYAAEKESRELAAQGASDAKKAEPPAAPQVSKSAPAVAARRPTAEPPATPQAAKPAPAGPSRETASEQPEPAAKPEPVAKPLVGGEIPIDLPETQPAAVAEATPAPRVPVAVSKIQTEPPQPEAKTAPSAAPPQQQAQATASKPVKPAIATGGPMRLVRPGSKDNGRPEARDQVARLQPPTSSTPPAATESPESDIETEAEVFVEDHDDEGEQANPTRMIAVSDPAAPKAQVAAALPAKQDTPLVTKVMPVPASPETPVAQAAAKPSQSPATQATPKPVSPKAPVTAAVIQDKSSVAQSVPKPAPEVSPKPAAALPNPTPAATPPEEAKPEAQPEAPKVASGAPLSLLSARRDLDAPERPAGESAPSPVPVSTAETSRASPLEPYDPGFSLAQAIRKPAASPQPAKPVHTASEAAPSRSGPTAFAKAPSRTKAPVATSRPTALVKSPSPVPDETDPTLDLGAADQSRAAETAALVPDRMTPPQAEPTAPARAEPVERPRTAVKAPPGIEIMGPSKRGPKEWRWRAPVPRAKPWRVRGVSLSPAKIVEPRPAAGGGKVAEVAPPPTDAPTAPAEKLAVVPLLGDAEIPEEMPAEASTPVSVESPKQADAVPGPPAPATKPSRVDGKNTDERLGPRKLLTRDPERPEDRNRAYGDATDLDTL